ncbi:MAG: hypothetical protein NTV21_06045 [Planctomycetota bacterium]|nr:hypothetical protein [Planctomycetota bacterium]
MQLNVDAGDWSEFRRALEVAAADSPAVRRTLAQVGAWLCELASAAETAAAPVVAPVAFEPAPEFRVVDAPVPVQDRDVVAHEQAAERLRDAWKPRFTTQIPVTDLRPVLAPAVLAPRLRLKAESCRWAVERRAAERGTTEGAAARRQRTEELLRRAQTLGGVPLWMLSRDLELPTDGAMGDIAAAFDNLAHALEIAASLEPAEWDESETRESTLSHAAEAQSALRKSLRDHELPFDLDQDETFHWLQERTSTLRVYVQRHMRLDDPADPTTWDARGRRFAAFEDNLRRARERRDAELQLRRRLEYHAKRIRNTLRASGAEELCLDDWRRVFATVDELLELGVRASDPGLREVLAPLVEARPLEPEAPSSWERVVDEIDRALALKEQDDPAASATRPARERTPAMERVRSWLAGKRVVIIGGAHRPLSRQALVEAFELGELEWITTRAHEPLESFRASIVRPQTELILLLIRWSSHSFGELRHLADAHGKRFVSLPRGYNPAQVAEEILRQVTPE